MKSIHTIKIAVLAVASITILSACTATDTVGKFAVKSFDAVATEMEEQILFDENEKAWALTAPTGERFMISSDFTKAQDTLQEVDLQPFLDAGLDISKLDAALFQADTVTGKLRISGNLGDKALSKDESETMTQSLKLIVKEYRDSVGYHKKLDHYGIAMGNGNMLEWASDMSTNDKDLVFILNPEPFIEAGVDPTLLEGWAYAEVEMMDENDNPMFVYKFLKPFDIKK